MRDKFRKVQNAFVSKLHNNWIQLLFRKVQNVLVAKLVKHCALTKINSMTVYMCDRGGGNGEATRSETPSLMSYTLRYVSFVEVVIIWRVTLREPIHLCTCVIEEGTDGEDVHSETPSLLSYTLRYISFTEVGRVCRVVLREPMYLCTYSGWGGGRRGSCVLRNANIVC